MSNLSFQVVSHYIDQLIKEERRVRYRVLIIDNIMILPPLKIISNFHTPTTSIAEAAINRMDLIFTSSPSLSLHTICCIKNANDLALPKIIRILLGYTYMI